MKAIVYSKEGKKKGEVVLNPAIFAAQVNARLLELVRNAYSANLRRGTADTKVRKEVRGGGKKPWKQKGTGRARHSSIRSPIWRGGGTVFGPHPRSYFVNMPRTMRRTSLISALSLRGEQKNILILEDVKLESPKTKEFAEIVKSLPLDEKRALCVVKEIDQNLERASRNLGGLVEVRKASDLNAYDVLQKEKVILEEDAVAALEGRLLEDAHPVEIVEAEEGKPGKTKKAAKKPRVAKKTKAAKSAAVAAKRNKVKAKKAPAAKKPAAKKGKKS